MGGGWCPFGVGDAFSEVRGSSALALEHEGRLLLVDCPHPMRKMLRETSTPRSIRR
jgi:hypothetical protein